jgi:hypothetical protein
MREAIPGFIKHGALPPADQAATKPPPKTLGDESHPFYDLYSLTRRSEVRFRGQSRLKSTSLARLVLRSRRIEQLPRLRDVLGTLGAGEQTVVADAVEAAGQHMDEEAAAEARE